MLWAIKWLHLLAAVFWIGGMLFLTIVLAPHLGQFASVKERMQLVNAIGRRFRNTGWVAIGLLLTTGVLNLLLRDFHLGQFIDTRFGMILSIKLGIVLLMLILALIHDFILGPKLTRLGQASGATLEFIRLRRRVSWLARLNLLLGILVIFLGVGL